MKSVVSSGVALTLCLYTILHYVTTLFSFETLEFCLSVTGILTVVFAGVRLKIKSFALPLFLLTVAVVIQAASGGSIYRLMMEGILEMRSLIALLLIVPVISWILKEGPYIEEIMRAARNLLHTSKRFYFGIMLINQVIAYFLLFGAIPMMYQFIDGFLKEKKGEAWEYFKSTALLRSFSLTTLWVVSIPSFAFAVDHLGASLGWAILQGFLVSLAGITLAVVFASRREKQYGVNITAGIEEEMDKLNVNAGQSGKWNRYVVEFGLLFFSLFGTVFLLNMTTGIGLLLAIPPVIVIWTCGYFILKKKSRHLLKHSKDYFKNELQYKSLQFSLLLSAGILIYSVNQSGIGSYMVDGLFFLEESIPFLNFLTILPFTVIALGFFGLGPLTVIVLVAGILEGVNLSYPPELVVLSMTSGSVISVLLSPLILPIIVLSASNGLGVIKNGFSFNFGYAIVFYCIVQIYIQFMLYVLY